MEAAAAAHSKQSLTRPSLWTVVTLAAAAALLVLIGVVPLPDVEGPLEDGIQWYEVSTPEGDGYMAAEFIAGAGE